RLQPLALLDMGLEIADVPAALCRDARSFGEANTLQRLPHAAIAVAVTRGVDVSFGDGADIGTAAEEGAEMTFLVAPRGDLDGTVEIRVAIERARGFQRIDHAERPIQPAGIILAFEMRAREQFGAGFRARAEHIADAVDGGGEARLRKARRQPFQRAHMGFGEGRLVHTGLVGADRTQRVEIGKDTGAIGASAIVRHGARPWPILCAASMGSYAGLHQSLACGVLTAFNLRVPGEN